MNESRIKELVVELETAVPKDGAMVSFRQYGGGPDECKMVGTRAGLLRAGVELLKAGLAPVDPKETVRSLGSLCAMTHSESDFFFDRFEEKALPEDRLKNEGSATVGKFIGIGFLSVVLVTVGFAIYGVIRLFHG